MVVGPPVKNLLGYDRTGEGVNAAIPYVMWKDTPYEHLMIPVRKSLRPHGMIGGAWAITAAPAARPGCASALAAAAGA